MQTKYCIALVVLLALCACVITIVTVVTADDGSGHSSFEGHKLHKQMVQATLSWRTAKLHGLGQRIPVVTVNTRSDDAFYPMQGAEGISMTNVGVHGEWVSMLSKNEMLLDWFDDQLPKYHDELVIVVDAADTVYGGCEIDTLLTAYRHISTASGGSAIVVSAELASPPKDDKYAPFSYASLNSRRQTMWKAASLDEYFWLVNASQRKDCLAVSSDSKSANASACHRYEFMDYGFLMGPVGALRELFAFVVRTAQPGFLANLKGYIDSSQKRADEPSDEDIAAMYMFNNPSEVTLDYSMGMTASFHDMPKELLDVKNGHLLNTATNHEQCFVHFNGNSHTHLFDLLERLRTSRRNEEPPKTRRGAKGGSASAREAE